MAQELRRQGRLIGKNRVQRRMRALGLKVLAKRKWKATTDSKHTLPVADNLLNRDWSTTKLNQNMLLNARKKVSEKPGSDQFQIDTVI